MTDQTMAQEETDEFAGFSGADGVTTDAPDEFSDFAPDKATVSDKATALRQGMVGGASEFGAMVPGAMIGTKVGALGGTAVLPGLGTIVGGALGFFGGGAAAWYAGSELREFLSDVEDPFSDKKLTFEKTSELPENVRAYGVAGETFGGAWSGGGGVAALGQTTLRYGQNTLIGRYTNRILDAAKNTPRSFIAAETSGAGGAAFAGGVAESEAPGNTSVRVAAELAGGFFNPTRIVVSSANAGKTVASKFLRNLPTAAGARMRENEAARIVGEVLSEYGEDPIVVRELLLAHGLDVGEMTVAAKSGSPALAGLEKKLSEMNARFGSEAARMSEANLDNLAIAAASLKDLGDPASLKAAAAMEQLRFKTVLSSRMKLAEAEAFEAASALKADTPLGKSKLSAKINQIMLDSYEDIRVVQSELWDGVSKTVRASGTDIAAEARRLKAETMLPSEKLPDVVEAFMRRVRKIEKLEEAGKEVPEKLAIYSNDLIILRSRMLELGREAIGKGDLSDARVYSHMAEAVLDEADGLMRGMPEYETARNFSREFNQTFKQTFAGSVQRTGPDGADRLSPELVMHKAIAGGDEASNLKFGELERATRFLKDQNVVDVDVARDLVPDLMQAQEDFLRIVVSETVDPNTGVVNPSRVQAFLGRHSELLDRFPNLKTQIDDALSSAEGLSALEATQRGQTKILDAQTAFGKLAKVENPVQAVTTSMGGNAPVGDLVKLAKLAKRGPGAVEGLRASVIAYAMGKATNSSGRVDFAAMRKVLFDPINEGDPSMIGVLLKENVVDDATISRMKKIFDTADNVTSASTARAISDLDMLQETDGLTDLILRGGGAFLATTAAKSLGITGSGPSLVIAAGGSRQARRLFDKVPQGMVQQILIDAAQNPEFMAMLLAKPSATKDKLKLLKQLHAYVLSAGYFAARDKFAGDDESVE
tara:strand:+ start:2174 stop:4984 length:2811 start_codon:yes stop_codon:yes gene_type:complete